MARFFEHQQFRYDSAFPDIEPVKLTVRNIMDTPKPKKYQLRIPPSQTVNYEQILKNNEGAEALLITYVSTITLTMLFLSKKFLNRFLAYDGSKTPRVCGQILSERWGSSPDNFDGNHIDGWKCCPIKDVNVMRGELRYAREYCNSILITVEILDAD